MSDPTSGSGSIPAVAAEIIAEAAQSAALAADSAASAAQSATASYHSSQQAAATVTAVQEVQAAVTAQAQSVATIAANITSLSVNMVATYSALPESPDGLYLVQADETRGGALSFYYFWSTHCVLFAAIQVS
jgi:hypothetical protein